VGSGMEKFGSGIRDKHPGSATLEKWNIHESARKKRGMCYSVSAAGFWDRYLKTTWTALPPSHLLDMMKRAWLYHRLAGRERGGYTGHTSAPGYPTLGRRYLHHISVRP
jgi:hypothetical protein